MVESDRQKFPSILSDRAVRWMVAGGARWRSREGPSIHDLDTMESDTRSVESENQKFTSVPALGPPLFTLPAGTGEIGQVREERS